MDPRSYRVSRNQKAPLLAYICGALEECRCRLIHVPDAGSAPFRFTFEAPTGERMGIMAYAFFANSKPTKNRPPDEHRFQVKYSLDDRLEHEIWQDPYGLYTTLFCGIDTERGTFVGADPVLHNLTRFFISIEYKQEQSRRIMESGWCAWERERRSADEKPIEVLVGGTSASFLRYVQFEREACRESQGHRQLLAERPASVDQPSEVSILPASAVPGAQHLHQLSREFELSEAEVLDLIGSARRLKMAVRGWVAEEHLVRHLKRVDGVDRCERLDLEGQPDVALVYRGIPLRIECKNVLRKTNAEGLARMDFQRTRASKGDPCSRYYAPTDFDVLAACLHAVQERWVYRFAIPARLERHHSCQGKLANNVKIDGRWTNEASAVLAEAAKLVDAPIYRFPL